MRWLGQVARARIAQRRVFGRAGFARNPGSSVEFHPTNEARQDAAECALAF